MNKLDLSELLDYFRNCEPSPAPEPLPSLEGMTVDDLYSKNLTAHRWDEEESRNVITVPKFENCNRCMEGYVNHPTQNAMMPCPHCLTPWRS